MVYDIRLNMISSSFKHSQKYPISSIATFKPPSKPGGENHQVYNRSNVKSPMALVAAGGPSYELSLLNLETGNIEYLISSEDQ